MSIELTVVYTCQLPDVEQVASLSVWLNFSDKRMVDEFPVKFAASDNVTSLPITIKIPLVRDKTGVTLPADAAVMFEVMASVYNEEHVRVRVRGGYTRILLKELILDAKKKYAIEYFNDWDEKTGKRTPCGQLDVTAVKYNEITAAQITFQQPDMFSFVDENSDFLSKIITCIVARKIVPLTEEAAARGLGLTPTRQILSRVQAPWYNTTAGVTYAPFYVMLVEPSSNNSAYYDELIKLALARHNRSEDWFHSTIEDQFDNIATNPNYFNDDFNNVVRVIGDVLCMPSTALPYISDYVDSNKRNLMATKSGSSQPFHDPKLLKPSESWDCAIIRNGGDCEDLARLIHLMFQGIKNGKFPNDSLAFSANRVLQLYVGCFSLGSVLAPSLGNTAGGEPAKKGDAPTIINSKQDVDAEVGAHMWYVLHRRTKLTRFMRKTTTNLPPSIDGKYTQPGWENLISCILEGTGRLDPFQLPAAALSTSLDPRVRQALVDKEMARRVCIKHLIDNTRVTSMMQMTRAQKMLKRIPNARLSEFYMQSTTMVTNEFINDLGMMEFMWATLGERVPEPANANPLFLDDAKLLSTGAAVPPSCCCDGDGDSEGSVGAIEGAIEDNWKSVSSILGGSSKPSVFKRSEQHAIRAKSSLDSQFVRGVGSLHDALNNEISVAARTLQMPPNKIGDLPIRYGIDVEDTLRLRDAPHVALLLTTSIDPIEARVGAETFRNLRPVTLPGAFANAERLMATEQQSLAAIGVDMRHGEDEATKAYAKLKNWASATMDADNWPNYETADKQNLSLITLFFAKAQLRPKRTGDPQLVVNSIIKDYSDLKKSGAIKYGRVGLETPLPRRDHVVLQFLMDSSLLK